MSPPTNFQVLSRLSRSKCIYTITMPNAAVCTSETNLFMTLPPLKYIIEKMLIGFHNILQFYSGHNFILLSSFFVDNDNILMSAKYLV